MSLFRWELMTTGSRRWNWPRKKWRPCCVANHRLSMNGLCWPFFSDLVAVVPLRLKDEPFGLIVILALLPQKNSLELWDYALCDLLSKHAAACISRNAHCNRRICDAMIQKDQLRPSLSTTGSAADKLRSKRNKGNDEKLPSTPARCAFRLNPVR